MSVSRPIKIIAPAKINLFLHITGRLQNMYHQLESVFVFTKGGDVLTLEPCDDIRLIIEGPFASVLNQAKESISQNLVVRAARLFQDLSGQQRGVLFKLTKNLPVAAGIGGGSSDAAAALKGLSLLWDCSVSDRDLHTVALALGADVPACLRGVPCRIQGIGEKITALERGPSHPVLLLNPLKSASTPQIFDAYKHKATSFTRPLLSWPVTLKDIKDQTRNDLTKIAISMIPEIDIGLEFLRAQYGSALVRMSGSGATVFAIFDHEHNRDQAEKAAKRAFPHWWIWSDTLISGSIKGP